MSDKTASPALARTAGADPGATAPPRRHAGGRPPKPPGTAREHQVAFSVTTETLERLRESARRAGRAVAAEVDLRIRMSLTLNPDSKILELQSILAQPTPEQPTSQPTLAAALAPASTSDAASAPPAELLAAGMPSEAELAALPPPTRATFEEMARRHFLPRLERAHQLETAMFAASANPLFGQLIQMIDGLATTIRDVRHELTAALAGTSLHGTTRTDPGAPSSGRVNPGEVAPRGK